MSTTTKMHKKEATAIVNDKVYIFPVTVRIGLGLEVTNMTS